MALVRIKPVTSASTRSAMHRSAMSRSAARLPSRKTPRSARAAWSGFAQLLDILPALQMAAARCVAVPKLIKQQDARTEGKCCVEVELLQNPAGIGDSGARQGRQLADRGLGLDAAMRLDDADHQIIAARCAAAALGQHLPSLADTRPRRRGTPSAGRGPRAGPERAGHRDRAGRVPRSSAQTIERSAGAGIGLCARFMRPRRNTHGAFAPAARTPLRPSTTDGRTMLDLLVLAIGLGGFALMALYVAACGRV